MKKHLLMFTVLATLALSGCGKKTAAVKGKVLYRNKPLPVAKITFIGEKGKVQGDVVDGEFEVAMVPLGDSIKVTVETQPLVEEIARLERMEKEANRPLPGLPRGKEPPTELKAIQDGQKADPDHLKLMKDLKQRLVPVPPRYQSDSTTPLAFRISGNQEITITLENQ